MTTVVNNPVPTSDGGGNSFLVGAIFLIVFVTVLIYFGIPIVRNMGANQMSIPTPQIVVPDNVKVEVTEGK